jgi:hypothetical protein
VARCPQPDLAECPNLQSVRLSSGIWVVQAKLTALGALAGGNMCGLVTDDTTTVDLAAPLQADINNNFARFSLAAVITLDEPARVALRCSEFGPLDLSVFNLDLIATSVDEVVSS